LSKILIVEDDSQILISLTTRLRAKGHDVVSACDGAMAMTRAVNERPDLVILDISLPGGSGLEVAERIQGHVATVGVPMIFLTASRQPGLGAKARELGALAFFRKPYDPERLLRAVQRAASGPTG
jgi:DNA-binding response OmpR family regulator